MEPVNLNNYLDGALIEALLDYPFFTSLLLSLLGGLAGFLQGIREERIKSSLLDFLAEITLSLVAGILAFFMSASVGVPLIAGFVFVLVTASNSSDFIAATKRIIDKFIDNVWSKR